ncbi:MAG: type II secretion system protein GspN [Deltaproteobacteria bacterium]|nr:type II secretion system protein GspN [Deltaproteobacteria bacterium]
MRNIIQTILLGLALFIFFLIFTFPFSRLGPKVQVAIENGFKNFMQTPVNCDLDGFNYSFPFGIKWKNLSCRNLRDSILEVSNGNLSFFPSQKVSGQIGAGKFQISTDIGIKKSPSRVSAQLDSIPMEKISPLVMVLVARANPLLPRDMKMTGKLQGKMDWPLKNLSKESGALDLKFDALTLPEQSLLRQIGLKNLVFSKADIKANLNLGKLTFTDTAFLSPHLSGKVDGQADLQDDLAKSTASLNLKWKVQRSDAMQSSMLGAILLAAPCPSPDSEGFCTRRINRLADLGI